MHRAKFEVTGQEIEAEELLLLDDVSSHKFFCIGCGIELISCFFKKNINLRPPYFRKKEGSTHEVFCSEEEDSTLRDRGTRYRVTTNDGIFPLAYPNVFKLNVPSIESVQTVLVESSTIEQYKHKKSTSSHQRKPIRKNFTTSSFKRLVDEYFAFPHDTDRPLIFDGVEGATYSDIFKKIRNPSDKQTFLLQGMYDKSNLYIYFKKKVYFSKLDFINMDLNESYTNKLVINLFSGLWSKEEKRYKPNYYLEIDMTSWKDLEKKKFIKKIQLAYAMCRDKTFEAEFYVVFLGEQSKKYDNTYKFIANLSNLIDFKIIGE